mmetsp:Transcript_24426/g.34084  ORF Transcript_24426/g.34084 Transcript_24426/m.34084 type:complete len:100 (+) Transcript_24426:366-665(+)
MLQRLPLERTSPAGDLHNTPALDFKRCLTFGAMFSSTQSSSNPRAGPEQMSIGESALMCKDTNGSCCLCKKHNSDVRTNCMFTMILHILHQCEHSFPGE